MIRCGYAGCDGGILAAEERSKNRWFGVCDTCDRTNRLKHVSLRDGVLFGNASPMGPQRPKGYITVPITFRRDQVGFLRMRVNASETVRIALDRYMSDTYNISVPNQ